MASATNGVTVPCTINRDVIGGTWVEVRNNLTGNSLVLDLNEKGMDQTRFRGEWADLWTMLGNVEDGDFIDLTPRQMQTFKAMVDYVPRTNAAKGESKSASGDVVMHETKAVNGVSTVKGVENAAEKVEGMRRVIENVQNDTYVLLQYDIPESSPFANPSSMLWWHGFRMTKSVWVLPSRRVKYNSVQALLNRWKAYNDSPERLETRDQKPVKYRILPFAEETMEEIKSMAVEALYEYVRELHTSLIERIASADETLKKAHATLDEQAKNGEQITDKQYKKAVEARMNAVRALLKAKDGELNAAIASAELFDATEDVGELLKGLRNAISAAKGEFNARAGEIGVKPAA